MEPIRDRTEDPQPTLTAVQRAVVDFARRDLESARAANLPAISAADLILTVERLRGRLDSVLEVLDEVLGPPQR